MCGRFTMVSRDELDGIVRAIECCASFNVDADYPAQTFDAFPGSEVTVLRLADTSHDVLCGQSASAITSAPLIWGFDLSGQGKTVFNTRVETAATSNFWRESFLQHRCIVPARAFFEPHRSERALRPAWNGAMPSRSKTVKQTYRFTNQNGGILLLAGIWAADRFSILTTEPDAVVSLVHDRMPLILRFEDAFNWLQDKKAPSQNRDCSAGQAASSIEQADSDTKQADSSTKQTDGNTRQAMSEIQLCAAPMYPPATEVIQQTLF